jgi:hypothetical protein
MNEEAIARVWAAAPSKKQKKKKLTTQLQTLLAPKTAQFYTLCI